MEKKYVIVYNEIVNLIEQGKYLANSKLPSEKELMLEYGVSRDTVRKALNNLEQFGYIQKNKGKCAFVLDINLSEFPVSSIISFKELSKSMGKNVNTIVEKLTLCCPSNKIKNILDIGDNDKVWHINRVREINLERVILDKDYVVEKIVDGLTEEICGNSLFEYFENNLNLKISHAKKEITVKQASDEDKKYLDMKNHKMIVVVKNYNYLNDGRLFQFTESRHRPDKFVFVDFARRNKN